MLLKNQLVFSLSENMIKKKFFDLKFYQNKSTGVIYHKPSRALRTFITKRYFENSKNNTEMKFSNHRKKHGDRFIEYLKNNLNKKPINLKILEIGCGDAYILNKLKMNNEVYGIELKIKKKRKIKFYKNLEEPLHQNQKFDLIIHNAVLEHIFDLERFLKICKDLLKKNGDMFFCVPDCELALKAGDPSIINHEHINYFTKKNLLNLMIKNKFFSSKTFSDKYGNLYCHIKNLKNKEKKLLRNYEKLKDYKKKFFLLKNNMNLWIKKNFLKKDKLILYGAISTISNIFSSIRFNKNNIFIVDTDKAKHDLYLTGFGNKITSIKKYYPFNSCKIMILPINYEKEILNFLKFDCNISPKMIFKISYFFNK